MSMGKQCLGANALRLGELVLEAEADLCVFLSGLVEGLRPAVSMVKFKFTLKRSLTVCLLLLASTFFSGLRTRLTLTFLRDP